MLIYYIGGFLQGSAIVAVLSLPFSTPTTRPISLNKQPILTIIGKFAGTTITNGGNTGRKDCIYSINIKLNNATSVLITDRTINILFITSESNRQEKINVICEEDNRRKIIFILSSYH